MLRIQRTIVLLVTLSNHPPFNDLFSNLLRKTPLILCQFEIDYVLLREKFLLFDSRQVINYSDDWVIKLKEN